MSELELLELEFERRARERAKKPLIDFVPATSPRIRADVTERPDHAAPVAKLFDRIEAGESVQACISLPPQHGKTELISHGIARRLRTHPDHTIGYVSFAAQPAAHKSLAIRQYAERAGVALDLRRGSAREWHTRAGGGLLAVGIGGALTSYGLQLLVVDDPFENRKAAESEIRRQAVHEWFTSTGVTRVHPGGSIIVVHTRWHEDDLIGRLAAAKNDDGSRDWEYINIPAVCVDTATDPLGRELGEVLWPSKRPKAFLERRRRIIGEYDWWSLYMGSPRPRGSSLFEGTNFYDNAPNQYAIGIGIDGATSKKSRADFYVCVVIARVGNDPATAEYFVLDVVRKRNGTRAFARDVQDICARWHSDAWWYTGGQEAGLADLMSMPGHETERHEHGPSLPASRIVTFHAGADKFIRAQPFAAAWNDNRVFVPRGAPWLDEYLRELHGFPNGTHDDQVDASAAAFDMASSAALGVTGGGAQGESFDDVGVGM